MSSYKNTLSQRPQKFDKEFTTHDKDKRCAPSQKFVNGSCISINLLINLAEAYNKYYKDQIKVDKTCDVLNPDKCKEKLLKQFEYKLSNVCSDQRCWIKQDFIKEMTDLKKNELTKFTFRPTGPQGKYTWLNTTDIQDVMKQYERKYENFKFLGALPIDFNELTHLGICSMDFDQVVKKAKKNKICAIFNLDESYKSGSHWVSLYSDMASGKVYFFDSYGLRPDKRIRHFMRRLARYIQYKMNNKIDVRYNKNRHQYKNSECGVYSINFILRMLDGEDFDYICDNKVFDDKINQYRKLYFNNA